MLGLKNREAEYCKAVCPLLLKKHLKRQLKPSAVYKLSVELSKSEFVASRIYQIIGGEIYLP